MRAGPPPGRGWGAARGAQTEHADRRLMSPVGGTPVPRTQWGAGGICELTGPDTLLLLYVPREKTAGSQALLQGCGQPRAGGSSGWFHTPVPTSWTRRAPYPWPALRCLLISFSPSMIHCIIFWFFSVSSDGPGASVPTLFPDSAFLALLLGAALAFPLQEQELGVTCQRGPARLRAVAPRCRGAVGALRSKVSRRHQLGGLAPVLPPPAGGSPRAQTLPSDAGASEAKLPVRSTATLSS